MAPPSRRAQMLVVPSRSVWKTKYRLSGVQLPAFVGDPRFNLETRDGNQIHRWTPADGAPPVVSPIFILHSSEPRPRSSSSLPRNAGLRSLLLLEPWRGTQDQPMRQSQLSSFPHRIIMIWSKISVRLAFRIRSSVASVSYKETT
jgi:hypothetical protein